MVHPAQEKRVRLASFVTVWAAILGLMGSFILWPAQVGTVLIILLALGVTGMMAWSVTHLEDE